MTIVSCVGAFGLATRPQSARMTSLRCGAAFAAPARMRKPFRALLRQTFRASVTAPLVLAACGGQVGSVGDGDGGTSSDASAANDAQSDGPTIHGRGVDCFTNPPDASASPCSFQLPIEGDPVACGLTQSPPDSSLCQRLCHEGAGCSLVNVGGAPFVQCNIPCGTGRRPEGFAQPTETRAPSALGRWWADVAALESASVDAFSILRAELDAHGAPKRLLRAAERAAKDEVRHARVTESIARRYGGAPRRTRIARRDVRPLEAIAKENAAEGCVRETFGSLVAMWQARAAGDPRVRAAMKRIAKDEARHAELAWQVARWLDTQLDACARERVRAARQAAIDGLKAELRQEPAAALVEHAGLPTARQASVLFDNASALLWQAA